MQNLQFKTGNTSQSVKNQYQDQVKAYKVLTLKVQSLHFTTTRKLEKPPEHITYTDNEFYNVRNTFLKNTPQQTSNGVDLCHLGKST